MLLDGGATNNAGSDDLKCVLPANEENRLKDCIPERMDSTLNVCVRVLVVFEPGI